jgi:hypothetical protein
MRILSWTGAVNATRVFRPTSEQRAAALSRLDARRLIQQLRRESAQLAAERHRQPISAS